MDLTYINPFINATAHVLETIAFTTVKAGKPYIKDNQGARGDVSGIVGLTGDANGTLSVSFSEESILSIVSNILKEEKTELNDEIKDAVGEITNMIAGQARLGLDDLGRSLISAIPTVIMGKNHTITHITTYPVTAVPFESDSGEFAIEVCFEEQE